MLTDHLEKNCYLALSTSLPLVYLLLRRPEKRGIKFESWEISGFLSLLPWSQSFNIFVLCVCSSPSTPCRASLLSWRRRPRPSWRQTWWPRDGWGTIWVDKNEAGVPPYLGPLIPVGETRHKWEKVCQPLNKSFRERIHWENGGNIIEMRPGLNVAELFCPTLFIYGTYFRAHTHRVANLTAADRTDDSLSMSVHVRN